MGPATQELASVWPYFLGALSGLLLVSGTDDLLPVIVWVAHWLKRKMIRPPLSSQTSSPLPERRIAILVPCWRESDVIGNMVRHNLAAIRYRNFDFFLGVYPNDEPTVRAAEELAAAFPNVHVAMCANPGPTSKADCLNWAYRKMQDTERQCGEKVDTVVLHDAEDLVHPQALATINRERAVFAMVQVPVLPLPTGWSDVTHGVYCDEFAEFQTIDMRARQITGSFIPSNGVGTGFSREVLDSMADSGKIFDEASLTEDYEIGVRIHASGYAQTFVPLVRNSGDFIATREFFPRTARTAIRQRTRWVTGIALQCWERHGWRGSALTRYWFWRDRKGLWANPLSVLANVVFVAGLLDYAACASLHTPWHFTVESRPVATLCLLSAAMQCLRMALRAGCVKRVYGTSAALGVPLRTFHANLINTCASAHALWNYLRARQYDRRLTWQKTEHAYPAREHLQKHRRALLDVLLGGGYLSEAQVEQVRNSAQDEAALDLLLLAKGVVAEENLCQALSLQSGLAIERVVTEHVNRNIARSLPALVQKRCNVVPFEVRDGTLLMATSRVPNAELVAELSVASDLPVDLRLVTKSAYENLEQLLKV